MGVHGDILRGIGVGAPGISVDRARDLLNRLDELPKLDELPGLLRFYADYIEMVCKLTARGASRGTVTLRAMMPLELFETIQKKTVTSKPRWDDIATLLQAAYSAVGIRETVDPKALQMQYRRWTSHNK